MKAIEKSSSTGRVTSLQPLSVPSHSSVSFISYTAGKYGEYGAPTFHSANAIRGLLNERASRRNALWLLEEGSRGLAHRLDACEFGEDPLGVRGDANSKLMLRCSYLAWSVPEANLVACDEKMLMAGVPALALMPSLSNSTSTPFALSCEAPKRHK